jgi:hypothetical protein
MNWVGTWSGGGGLFVLQGAGGRNARGAQCGGDRRGERDRRQQRAQAEVNPRVAGADAVEQSAQQLREGEGEREADDDTAAGGG